MIELLIVLYGIVALILWPWMAVKLAYRMSYHKWCADRRHYSSITSKAPPERPNGEQYFGGVLLAFLAVALLPAAVVFYVADERQYSAERRVRELEKFIEKEGL